MAEAATPKQRLDRQKASQVDQGKACHIVEMAWNKALGKASCEETCEKAACEKES